VPHLTPLIGTMVAGLVIAFLFGALAHRLKLPPIVGYLLAGVVVGPFTPGYVADQQIATDLAELGVILLMFGVGLHFSLRELLSVRKIAVPGAVVQIAVATGLGWLLAVSLGWSHAAGLTFGLALSVASTVVLLRAMQERRLLDTERGRIAVGWLIVEDVAMVLTLVLLPVMAASATPAEMAAEVGITLLKVAAFVAAMLIVGRRAIPWLLHVVAHTGSRELFRLAVLAIALGVALGAALLFGVSFALGAFFAGMILAESPFSQRAGEETLPLRDAFAVLFFVSVGMLFNPSVLVDAPLALAGIWPRSSRRADHRCEPSPDRRILVHPCDARQRARTDRSHGEGPDPGRRNHFDPAESAGLCACRAAQRNRFAAVNNQAIARVCGRADRPWPGRKPHRLGTAGSGPARDAG
jgi:K+:H+ antiporter